MDLKVYRLFLFISFETKSRVDQTGFMQSAAFLPQTADCWECGHELPQLVQIFIAVWVFYCFAFR